MPTTPPAQCDNCIFYRAAQAGATWGWCVKNPPSAMLQSVQGAPPAIPVTTQTGFPRVYGVWWCGDYVKA